jgi:2-polyprenyl-3-methyl-5-hydroxy-6-metoxy-1,4-benzoquinol methylase
LTNDFRYTKANKLNAEDIFNFKPNTYIRTKMNKSETFWDKSAYKFDQAGKKDELTYIKIIDRTKKYLKTSDTVLDFGCGTGLISNEIAGNVKLIHAIDISSKMIEIAKNKADNRKIQNIDYTYSTIFDERYKSGSFDVILAFNILHLLEDNQKTIQRINDLLKPGGLIISVIPCIGEKIFLNISLSFLSKIGLVPDIKSFKANELEDLIANANFQTIENESLHQGIPQYFIVAKKI